MPNNTVTKASRPTLPPGPNAPYQMFANLRAAQTDTLNFMLSLTQTYGGIVRFRAGLTPVYLVSHPAYIRPLLLDQYRAYSKNTFTYNSIREMFGLTLITSDGDVWLRKRRTLQPAFHRKRIEMLDQVVSEVCQTMLARWHGLVANGQSIDLREEMMKLTLSIASKAFFEVDMSADVNEVGEAFMVMTHTFMKRFLSRWATVWSMLGFPFPKDPRTQAARATLDQAVSTIIEKLRTQGGQEDKFVAQLVHAYDPETGQRMNDDEVRSEVATLLFTGHETTTHALAWTWYLLANHPDKLHILRQELKTQLNGRLPTAQDLPNLPYTRMVIEEALRLYPPVWAFSRRAETEEQVGNYRIPKGARILISPYVAHRLPEFWDEPEQFCPERFANERQLADAYLPFGAGPRQCIGRGFAMFEAQLVVATVAQQYRLCMADSRPVVPVPGFTLRPQHPMFMTIKPAEA